MLLSHGSRIISSQAKLLVQFRSVSFVFFLSSVYRNDARRVLDTLDGRALVAIGCSEGVWIGFRHDPKCAFFAKVVNVHALLTSS